MLLPGSLYNEVVDEGDETFLLDGLNFGQVDRGGSQGVCEIGGGR